MCVGVCYRAHVARGELARICFNLLSCGFWGTHDFKLACMYFCLMNFLAGPNLCLLKTGSHYVVLVGLSYADHAVPKLIEIHLPVFLVLVLKVWATIPGSMPIPLF